MTDRVGQQLGNYRLVRLLGRGGFAEVYLGEHLHLGTQAAIKILHTRLAHDDVDTFRNEARTIARLVHPHIVRVFDFGIEGETPFLVMDYAPNGTARQRHPKGVSLPLPTILSYVKQVADALQYAHEEHFIHRDIKPENLLVGRRQEVLLSDFGIALLAQTSRSQSMQDVAGTASYMAPEQFQGKPHPASDQYALAIMVYEWLTGACPFHGSFTEITSQHLFVPPPSLRQKMPTISPEVEQVVMTALAKDPKERFGSVQAFANALEQACQPIKEPNPQQRIGYREGKQALRESIHLFFSYARRDQTLRDQLENHLSNLKYRGLITTWHAREISAGEEAIQQIDIHLNTAHIILLLISANYLASEYCSSREMMQALQRHERGEAHVVPVLLRPVLFTDAPFAKFTPLPTNGKPVTRWRDREEAFYDIAQGIERLVLSSATRAHFSSAGPFGMPKAEMPPLYSTHDASHRDEMPLPFAYGGIQVPASPRPAPLSPRPTLQRRSFLRPVLLGLSLLMLGILSFVGLALLSPKGLSTPPPLATPTPTPLATPTPTPLPFPEAVDLE